MAAMSDKTGGSIDGNKTTSASYLKSGKPGKLPKDIKALRDKYGADTLYQILGRDGTGADRSSAVGVPPVRAGGRDGLGQPGVLADQSYPVRLYAPDPYDSTVEIKKAAPDNVFGKKMMTDRDVEWLARKRDQMTAAEFKQFVASMYNKNDPAQLALLHEVYPQLLEEQKAIVNERFDLIKRLTMMSLTGKPESQEDLQLLFALNTGAIKLPTGSMWDPSTWSDGSIAQTKQAALARGIFSPVRLSVAGKGDSSKMPFDALRWAQGTAGGGSTNAAAWVPNVTGLL